jgi:hypothetical protein
MCERKILCDHLQSVSYEHVEALAPAHLYRGFESLPLRHAVWTAENFRLHFHTDSQILPFFVIFAAQSGPWRTDYPGGSRRSSSLFLRCREERSGLQRTPKGIIGADLVGLAGLEVGRLGKRDRSSGGSHYRFSLLRFSVSFCFSNSSSSSAVIFLSMTVRNAKAKVGSL